jgi:anti-sigma B factor antagonist
MSTAERIESREIDGVRVLRFADRRLYDDFTVRQVGDALADAMPTAPGSRLVLDFSQVDEVSSSMIGKLLLVLRRMDAAKGKLRLCELSPSVRGVFRSTNLDRLFPIDRDLRESLEHLDGG